MEMQLNPIVKKDIRVQSRSMKICWGVFAYELILAFVFFLAMLIIRQDNAYSTNNIYSALVWLYPVLGVTQLIILGVVVPVRTASSISGERERQTFDIMMTTAMTPFSVILGKVMTAVVQSMLFVIASMPIMALSFVIGGMSWSYLFWFLGVSLLISLFSASIGILCSSLCKKSISAVIMSYGFYLVFFLGTILPYILYIVVKVSRSYTAANMGQIGLGEHLFLFFLLNPAIYLTEFFAQVMTGESVVGSLADISSMAKTKSLLSYVTTGHWWIILSTLLFLAVSFLFLWLASKRIDPIKGSAKKAAARQMMPPQMMVQQRQPMPPQMMAQQGQPMPPQMMVQQGQPMPPQGQQVPPQGMAQQGQQIPPQWPQ